MNQLKPSIAFCDFSRFLASVLKEINIQHNCQAVKKCDIRNFSTLLIQKLLFSKRNRRLLNVLLRFLSSATGVFFFGIFHVSCNSSLYKLVHQNLRGYLSLVFSWPKNSHCIPRFFFFSTSTHLTRSSECPVSQPLYTLNEKDIYQQKNNNEKNRQLVMINPKLFIVACTTCKKWKLIWASLTSPLT